MRRAAIVIALFLLVSTAAYADNDLTQELREHIPEAARAVTEEFEPEKENIFDRLMAFAGENAREILGEALGCACRVMACVIAASVVSGLRQGGGFDYAGLGAVLGISAISVSDASGLLHMGQETIRELKTFADVLLPALCTAAAATGATGSSAARYAAGAMFLDMLVNLLSGLVFPLICAYMAALTANAALPEGNLGGIVKLLRRGCTVLLGLTVSSFTLYLSVAGLVASSADALVTKAAKTAIAALPVVGGVMAEAAGSIIAGAGLIRTAVGMLGLLTVGAVCVVPVLRLMLRYLVFKAVAAIGDMCADRRICSLIDAVADAYGMILGTVGAEAAMIYISVISLIKAVGA